MLDGIHFKFIEDWKQKHLIKLKMNILRDDDERIKIESK
jgi:hypothetical protein